MSEAIFDLSPGVVLVTTCRLGCAGSDGCQKAKRVRQGDWIHVTPPIGGCGNLVTVVRRSREARFAETAELAGRVVDALSGAEASHG